MASGPKLRQLSIKAVGIVCPLRLGEVVNFLVRRLDFILKPMTKLLLIGVGKRTSTVRPLDINKA